MRYLTLLILLFVFVLGFYHADKSLPDGLDVRSELYPIATEQVQFLADRTYRKEGGEVIYEHSIFDIMLDLVTLADELVVMDMFLFNTDGKELVDVRRPLVQDLITAFLIQRANYPDSKTTIITDPMNTGYESYFPSHLQQLQDSGAEIIITNLEALPDSNSIYSAWYRAGLSLLPPIGGGILPNIFSPDGPGINLRGYVRLFNFKANHRKVLVTSGEEGSYALVSSMNVHDASSRHSNSGLLVKNHPIIEDILASEQAVQNFTDGLSSIDQLNLNSNEVIEGDLFIQLLTEQSIKRAVIERISSLQAGDRLDMAMFYISNREVVQALLDADERGVEIRLLFDPNRDAFGREKNGVPNRQVAHELMSNSIGNTSVRWCITDGEQCHSKFIITKTATSTELIIGSANFTRRNIDNLNLETNLRLLGRGDEVPLQDATIFFEEQWGNQDGRIYSTDYETFADKSRLLTWWYRFGEFTGLSHY